MSTLFTDACFNKKRSRTPVWMMRQAGRYLPEYRALKEHYDFLTMCKTPELAAKVTLMPIKPVNPDAAILFSDILIVLPPMGININFNPGPVISNPVKNASDIFALNNFSPRSELAFVSSAIKTARSQLSSNKALIGFCGAPLTIGAYLTKTDSKGQNFTELRSLFYSDKRAAHRLMDTLVKIQSGFLIEQIKAGVNGVQIFDTWAGSMPRDIIKEFVIPKVATIIKNVKEFIRNENNDKDVPVIYYIKDAVHVFDLLHLTGADVISIDEKVSIKYALTHIKGNMAIQGNLDSSILFASKEIITKEVSSILSTVPAGRGHIFNLGHGILPETPVENAAFMISEVKRLSKLLHD